MVPSTDTVIIATGVVTLLSSGLPLLRAEQAVWRPQKFWHRLELLVTEKRLASALDLWVAQFSVLGHTCDVEVAVSTAREAGPFPTGKLYRPVCVSSCADGLTLVYSLSPSKLIRKPLRRA